MESRRCQGCRETKPLDQFPVIYVRQGKTIYRRRCRACRNREAVQRAPRYAATRSAWKENNREKLAAQRRTYYEATRDRQIAATTEWRRKNRERYNLRIAATKVGLTLDQYRALLAKGACEICGAPANSDGRRLFVDHDHACCSGSTACGRCVRGLLCHRCNNGIARFNDDPELLHRAATYLLRSQDLVREMVV